MWVAVAPAAAFVAGIAFGSERTPSGPLAVGTVLACAVMCLCAIVAHRPALAMLVTIAGAAAAGATLGQHALRDVTGSNVRRVLADRLARPEPDAAPVVVTGTLTRDAERGTFGCLLILDATYVDDGAGERRGRGRVRVTVAGGMAPGACERWTDGHAVRLPVAPRTLLPFRNPGIPDQELALARRGIAALATVKSAALVEVLAPPPWHRERAARARQWVRRRAAQAIGPGRDASTAVVTAILLGDRAGLGDELEDRLQRAGTFHVIAISGGNIAVLALVCLTLLRAVGVRQRPSCLATAGVLVLHGVLVQGGASVVRATLMAVAWLALRAADLKASAVHVLAFTALAASLGSPLMAFDVGFALTCGATLGILLGAPPLLRVVSDHRVAGGYRVLRAVAGVGAATVAAELAVLPISATVFSMVTGAGLVLNFLAVPAMSVIQVAGLAAVTASNLHTGAAGALGTLAHGAVTALVESARLVDAWPWLARRVPPPPAVVLVLYYAALLVSLIGVGRRWRLGGGVTVAACLGAIWFGAPTGASASAGSLFGARPPDRVTITFLDVGQGDATLVAFPDGATMLVDAGGLPASTFDIGTRIVSPALWAMGHRRLQWFVATHGHPDHIGGGPAVLREFRPATVWEGIPVPGSSPLQALRGHADHVGAAWRRVTRGDRLAVGTASLDVWHPPPASWERRRVRNDDSIVLAIRHGAIEFVLTGDAGVEMERQAGVADPRVGVRLLKAGHHGSAGSTSAVWLAALRPRVVVVSAGRGNRFGHPAPATLARCRDAGADVFRTDHDGAIQAISDGRTLVVRTWHGKRWVERGEYSARGENQTF